MKILLAVDGSSYSNAAVEEVVRRPWPADTEVKVITAAEPAVLVGTEPWAPSPGYFEAMDQAGRAAAKVVIDSALSRLNAVKENLKISSEIIQGPARPVIVDEAHDWGADLIIMGSRGHGVWNRLLLGSVSDSVVHHARCSVEIVRSKEAVKP
jgi:nucleotide-binding universal stress UspA family protein